MKLLEKDQSAAASLASIGVIAVIVAFTLQVILRDNARNAIQQKTTRSCVSTSH
jgi:hypothetical protein